MFTYFKIRKPYEPMCLRACECVRACGRAGMCVCVLAYLYMCMLERVCMCVRDGRSLCIGNTLFI